MVRGVFRHSGCSANFNNDNPDGQFSFVMSIRSIMLGAT